LLNRDEIAAKQSRLLQHLPRGTKLRISDVKELFLEIWDQVQQGIASRRPRSGPDLVLGCNRRWVLSDGSFANRILADRILANWGGLNNRLRTGQICSNR